MMYRYNQLLLSLLYASCSTTSALWITVRLGCQIVLPAAMHNYTLHKSKSCSWPCMGTTGIGQLPKHASELSQNWYIIYIHLSSSLGTKLGQASDECSEGRQALRQSASGTLGLDNGIKEQLSEGWQPHSSYFSWNNGLTSWQVAVQMSKIMI